jgi:pimeloyl-ACP methyl ester carboxylesterase
VSRPFSVARADVELAGERWGDGGPVVVLLHAGVADRRSWYGVAERLAADMQVVAFDRRGHGGTPAPSGPFSHLDDLVAVVDAVGAGPVWVVGSSMGGGLALDLAVTAPDRVRGLFLIAPAVTGAPKGELDEATRALGDRTEAAWDAGEWEEVNRLETWLWLDGPSAPEGRVGGGARALMLAMNATVIANDAAEGAGASGVETWSRLGEIDLPVVVACGTLDLPVLLERSRGLPSRIPRARYHELPGAAHLPYLEDPAGTADLVRGLVGT